MGGCPTTKMAIFNSLADEAHDDEDEDGEHRAKGQAVLVGDVASREVGAKPRVVDEVGEVLAWVCSASRSAGSPGLGAGARAAGSKPGDSVGPLECGR